MASDFRNLRIWQDGYDLLMQIYNVTAKYPSTERYNLTSQINSSANGVIASIAESQGRFHYADKIRVLYIARGECYETRSHLSVAFGRKYISEKTFLELDQSYEILCKKINSYIESLNRKKTN